jgi:peptide/nickel transport system permease protein
MATTAATVNLKKTSAADEGKPQSQGALVFRRFRRHRMAVISLVVLTVILVASMLSPYITNFGRDDIDIAAPERPAPPGTVNLEGEVHWLGIDHLGRDLYTRVLYAGRISLTLAIFVVFLSETVGVMIGAVAGFYGGFTDSLVSRTIEFMLAVPLLPILLIVSAILLKTDAELPIPEFMVNIIGAVMQTSDRESRQVVVLILILVFFGWLGAARLMRGMALSLRSREFIEALRAQGASEARIIFRHVIPNGLAPILVNASLALGGVIILESALSFLGVGIQDPTPTWGNMLNQARSYMFTDPWLPLIPGIPLVLVSLCFNFIGDGLRDALDPRLKR